MGKIAENNMGDNMKDKENSFISQNIFSGIDIVFVERIRESIEKDANFLMRFFGDEERLLFNVANENYKLQRIAANFAAKEAFAKALQTGFNGTFAHNEIQTLRDKNGAPYLLLTGGAEETARKKQLQFSVSLSHTQTLATAIVIAINL